MCKHPDKTAHINIYLIVSQYMKPRRGDMFIVISDKIYGELRRSGIKKSFTGFKRIFKSYIIETDITAAFKIQYRN